MEIFGVTLPLWAVFIGIIIIVIVAWKLIKFAIKVLIAVIIFFALMIGLDFIGVFTWINENILTHFYG